jgi:hypothetical protein
MYYNPGEVIDFSAPDNNTRQSWWNIGLFSGYDREGLAVGAVENLTAQGMITAKREDGNAIGLIAKSALAEGFMLGAGKKVRSNRFVLNIGPDPYSALEGYADIMGRLNKARVNSIVNGWCNWFFTYEHVTEDEVVRNAEYVSRILKPYGMEYIQVDEGYQQWHGEWDGNDRFPHGMKWLAERIHNKKTYIAYDFWNNRFFGEVNNELKVRIPPASVLLLSIHQKSEMPKIISTDRHILQGAVELEDVKWDSDQQILSGISAGTPDTVYNVYIYIPDSHPWKQGGTALYLDFPDYTLKMADKNILRMHLRFDKESRMQWNINFPEFFKMDK